MPACVATFERNGRAVSRNRRRGLTEKEQWKVAKQKLNQRRARSVDRTWRGKADIEDPNGIVHFRGLSGHRAAVIEYPLMTQSGHVLFLSNRDHAMRR